MGVLENVLAKMQATPQFRPMSADTFSDWSIEAGDIITVDVGGQSQTLPVFSSDLDWGGAAMSTLSCSGSRERPTLSKAERQSYAAFGSVAREIQKANEKILEDRSELIAALNGEDGAPEDLAAGLQNYVRYDLKNSEAYAESTLFAQIGEKAKAEINVYAVESGGEAKTFAEILADQITLESEMEDAKASLELKADSKNLETVTGELQSIKTAQTALSARVSNAETSLTQKAEKTTVDTLDGRVSATEEAQTELASRVGDAETALTQKVSVREFNDAIDSQDEAIAEVQEAQASLTTRVGNVETGLSQKVSTDDLNDTLKNYALASALKDYLTVKAAQELYVTDSEVTAAIGAYIVSDSGGNKATLAAMLADIIKLQGDTEIVGNLTISDGRLSISKGVVANGTSQIWGDLGVSGKLFVNKSGLYVSGEPYTPVAITSTAGTEYTVLGQ